MKENKKIIILIPAYNPNRLLIKIVTELYDKKIKTIIVDDGSKNKDIFTSLEKKAIIIHHDINKGKGRALKTGLSYIKEKYKDEYIIVTMDADGQHSVHDAIKIANYCLNNSNSLILGSRKLNKNVPIKNKLGNTITRNIYSLVTKRTIYDTQTGLRAFSTNLVDKMLNISGERYEYEINVLLELSNEVPIKEIEIDTIYIDKNKGSNFNPIIDSYRIYKEIIKYSISSIISFLIIFKKNPYNIQISNITARIISATFNFIINKKIVFKHQNKLYKSLISYIILATFILIANTYILTLLVKIGFNKILAKIITELILFIISYTIQHFIIFKNNNN